MRLRTAAILLVAVPALAQDFTDSVDLEVRTRDRVHGTLRPADERESYYVACLRGTRVSATAVRSGGEGTKPSLELTSDALVPIATGRATGTGSKLSGVTINVGQPVRVRVTGDGTDGDYRLDLKFAPQTVWRSASAADLAPAEESSFAFAAPEGASAVIEIRRTAGSEFRPVALDVAMPSGGTLALDPPAVEATRQVIRIADLPDAGEYVVRFRNAGAAAGAWSAIVRLSGTRETRRTTDLRDSALTGDFAGAHGVFGRLADDDHDTDIAVPSGLGLDGVVISVPSGALSLPSVVAMTSSESFFVDDANHAAGTTVEFSPAGTTFGIPATVTVPYDADAFDDAANELTIVVQSADGSQETIPASSVDTGSSTATFPVEHFSRFQPVSPRARPVRGNFAEIDFAGRSIPGHGSEVNLGIGTVRVLKGPRDAGPLVRTARRRSLTWWNDPVKGPQLRAKDDLREDVPGFAQIPDDDTVVFATEGGSFSADRGRGFDALAGTQAEDDSVGIHVLLRAADGKPTARNLEGTWYASAFEITAVRRADQRLGIGVAARQFAIDVDEQGRAVARDSTLARADQVFPDAAWVKKASDRAPPAGRLAPLAPGSPLAALRMAVGASPAVREVPLLPAVRGDVLVGSMSETVGSDDDPDSVALVLVVLVRRGPDAELPMLPPDFVTAAFSAIPVDGTAGAPSSLAFGGTRARLAVAAGGSATFDGKVDTVAHGPAGLSTSSQSLVSMPAVLSLAPDGRIAAATGRIRGSIGPRRSVAVLLDPGKQALRLWFALPARPL